MKIKKKIFSEINKKLFFNIIKKTNENKIKYVFAFIIIVANGN